MSAKRQIVRTKEPVSPSPGATPAPPVYRVGRRALKVGDKYIEPGEVVPGAHTWPRVESWVRTGWLKED